MAENTCCCGCMSVKSGCIVIGLLSTISAMFTIISKSIAIATTSDYAIKDQQNSDSPLAANSNLTIALAKTILVASLTFGLLHFVLSLMLVVGSMKENKKLVYPMVAAAFMGILALVALFPPMLTFLISGGVGGGMIVGAVIGFFLSIALSVYIWLVISKFYNQLCREEGENYGVNLKP